MDDLKSRFGAKVVANKMSKVCADVQVDEGNGISMDTIPIKVIHTPGHSADSICLLVGGEKALTNGYPTCKMIGGT